MSCTPEEPDLRHVWVKGHGDYGAPEPGVVISWQHSPVHNATSSPWVALVALCPFDNGLVVRWVGAERLLPVRDPQPAA